MSDRHLCVYRLGVNISSFVERAYLPWIYISICLFVRRVDKVLRYGLVCVDNNDDDDDIYVL